MESRPSRPSDRTQDLPTAQALTLHDGDDVAVMTTDGTVGQICDIRAHDGEILSLTLKSVAPFGHKIAVRSLPKDHVVTKYGQPIGIALAAIEAGSHVHTHNLSGYRSNLRGEEA